MSGVQKPLFLGLNLLKSFRYLCEKLADQCKYVSDFNEDQTVSQSRDLTENHQKRRFGLKIDGQPSLPDRH